MAQIHVSTWLVLAAGVAVGLMLGASAAFPLRVRRRSDVAPTPPRSDSPLGERGDNGPAEPGRGHDSDIEPLDRLRRLVEARRTVEPPRRGLTSRPSQRRRAFDHTIRLARRHRWRRAGHPGSGRPQITLLGRVRVEGFGGELTSQQQAMVALLGLSGPATRNDLIDGLWGGRTISTSRFANLVSSVRSVIGRERLVQRADGCYELVGVSTDVDHFADLASSAATRSSESFTDPEALEALDQLEAVVDMIEGPILGGGHRRYWGWVDDQYQRRAEVEHLVVSAGLTMAALALRVHQPQRARWACERCLAAVPHDERLVATLAELHLLQGRRGAAADLVAGWEQSIRRLGLGEPSTGPRNVLVNVAAAPATGQKL